MGNRAHLKRQAELRELEMWYETRFQYEKSRTQVERFFTIRTGKQRA